MTLPASGSISLSQVNTELGYSSSAQISLNDSAVRTLFGVSSGAISMSNGYGKANQFAFTISSNQTNANLRTLAVNAGWNQTSKVVATIGSGVYISSDNTGVPALTISGSFPNGVEVINNGYIVGMGGNGGGGGNYGVGASGGSGGLSLSVSSGVSFTNNGTIAGGGGGGGGGGSGWGDYYTAGDWWWGQAAGGRGGGGRSSAAANSTGCNAGTVSSAGAGGCRQSILGYVFGGDGGAGGNWGSSGSSGASGSGYRGGGYGGGGGGSGGAAVTGNSNITWVATGTRLGSIS